jgi:hypothetical protein
VLKDFRDIGPVEDAAGRQRSPIGRNTECWQISRLCDGHRGSRNKTESRQETAGTKTRVVAVKVSGKARQGVNTVQYLNEGVIVFEISISPRGRGRPRDGERMASAGTEYEPEGSIGSGAASCRVL